MLQIDLRELFQGPVETQAEVAPTDPMFAGLELALAGPVIVGGRLQATGEERFYWHGTVRAVLTGECRRCLIPVAVPVSAEVGALFTSEADALEDPEAYGLPAHATEIDLRPAVREELVLAAPRYVVCREDCRGLCPQCGKDLNAGPCGCAPEPDPRWRALADLKGKLRE
jgi:DUF177 domain-containing protein